MSNTNINDNNNNNNNNSALDSKENRNTPGEEYLRSKANLKSVDSYPLNLQTEIPKCTEKEACKTNATPMLRLRGGVGEEVNEGQNEEEIVGERFILTTLDEEESEAIIGGRMEDAKLPGMIRISVHPDVIQMESKHIN
jgi:hypothetical protein